MNDPRNANRPGEGAEGQSGRQEPTSPSIQHPVNPWLCECCHLELPASLLQDPHEYPACPACGWPCDRPDARREPPGGFLRPTLVRP